MAAGCVPDDRGSVHAKTDNATKEATTRKTDDSGTRDAHEKDVRDESARVRRVQVGSDLATVRFTGPLPGTSKIWYGVEWDDPSRGKHDGSRNGVSYFTCRRPGCGSFMRPGPKVLVGRDFVSAVLEKYVDDESHAASGSVDLNTVFMPGKRGANDVIEVQTVGWDKVRKKQNATRQLTVAGLAEMRVEAAGGEGAVEELTPNIVDVDLSRNLMPDWVAVAEICCGLQKLEILRLNACRFVPITEPPTSPCFRVAFNSLRSLSLNSTYTQWSEFELLSAFFPVLEEVYLGFNAITGIQALPGKNAGEPPSQPISGLGRLRLVSLEGNEIRRWEDLERLSTLPSLENLLVVNNAIDHVRPPPRDAAGRVTGFSRLRSLNITGNAVSSWADIDNLNQYPSFRELRLKGNPVVIGNQAAIADVVVTSRLKNLTAYNGVHISPRDRVNAEVYYLNIFAKDWTKVPEEEFLSSHPRWKELCALHGDPVVDEEAEKENSAVMKNRLLEVSITRLSLVSSEAGKTVKKKLLGTTTVRMLKNLVQRLLGVPAAKQRLFLVATDESGARFEVPLADELRELKYYGVGPGAEIVCYPD